MVTTWKNPLDSLWLNKKFAEMESGKQELPSQVREKYGSRNQKQ